MVNWSYWTPVSMIRRTLIVLMALLGLLLLLPVRMW